MSKMVKFASSTGLLGILLVFCINANATVTWNGTEGVSAQIFNGGPDCGGCHNPTFGQTPHLETRSEVIANISAVSTRINAGTMPPSGALSAGLVSLFNSWDGGGEPNTAEPEVTTLSETSVGKYSATFRGNINENGINTSVDFEYATNMSFIGSSDTTDQSVSGTGGGLSTTSFTRSQSGLSCGTTYYYRARALDNGTYGQEDAGSQEFPTDDCHSITSDPTATVDEDTLYSHQLTLADTGGLSMTYSLLNAPAGMSLSSGGSITWTPGNGVSTSGTVTARAYDGTTFATQTFAVTVTPINDPPVLSNVPNGNTSEDTLFSYPAVVTDVDDDNDGSGEIIWGLQNAPAGMTISNIGLIQWTPTEGVSTSGVVTITVRDGLEDGSTQQSDTFAVAVAAVNDQPVLTAVPDDNATEDILFSYQAVVADPDDNNDGSGDLIWGLANAPTGMTISTTGLIEWSPSEGFTTSGLVTASVRDGLEDGSVQQSDTFTVSVTQVNDPPSFNSTAPTTAVEGSLYQYIPQRDAGATSIDPDDANDGSGALTWALQSEPAGMVVSSTGVVTWTPPNGVAAVGPIGLTVADGGEDGVMSFTEQFSMTINATNTPPVLTSVPDGNASEDIEFTYQVLVSDEDDPNDGTNLSFDLANSPTGMNISSTGLISWTPTEGQGDAVDIDVTVQDGLENGSTPQTDTFTVTVTAVNDQPVLSSVAAVSATEDQLYSYQMLVSDPDDANDGAELLWRAENMPSGMAVSNQGLIEWTPVEGQLSSGMVSVFVRDGLEDGSVEQQQDFTITVTAVNDQPVLDPVTLLAATEDELYSYQANVADVDDSNNGIDLIWRLQNAPVDMTVSTQGLIEWMPLEGVTTSGEVTVFVRDGLEDGAVEQQQAFTIAVTSVNDTPLISSVAPISGLEANPYSYQVTVDDPDDVNNGVDLSFSLSNAPADMTISATGLIHWIPPEGATTSGEITLTVVDGGEDSAIPATQLFTISVGIFNSPPSIGSIAPTIATEDVPYSYQVAASDVDDPNNGADLTFSLTNAPTDMMVSATGLVTWTPLEGVNSSGAVTVTVADGGEDGALPATEDFSVAVTAVNDAPVITSSAPTAVIELNPYRYQVNITDPDDSNDGGGDIRYSVSNAPTGLAVSATGLIEWIPPEGTRTSGEITLEVADGGEDGAVPAAQSFTINVTEFNTPPVIVSVAGGNATEDTQYRYQVLVNDIDDPNDGSGALNFILQNAPDGMAVSSTGLVTWTPLEGVTTSGMVALEVIDGGEDSAAPATEDFTVAVTRVNDAPTIVSQAPAEVNEDEEYRYQVELSDPDDVNNGSDFSFSLSNAPTGMSVSRIGLVTWQTDETSPPSSTVTISVSDGGEDGAQPVVETFIVVVNFDIDGDGIPNDDDNCRTIANADQADNEGDGEGNICDSDDDNDGIADDYEIANGLDPFDPEDANEDPDGDGVSNLDEFANGGNPNVDDVPPVITAPSNILRFSTGFETFVDIGEGLATDSLNGPLPLTPSRDSGAFRTGRHTVIWSATDDRGNTATVEQTIDVIPQLAISVGQSVEEGQPARIDFALNGEPVRYPVSVDYSISGSAQSNDHTLSNGTVILSDVTGSLQFTVLNDELIEGTETLIVDIRNPSNATLSGNTRHELSIVEENVAPRVELSVTQDGVPGLIVNGTGGQVIVAAIAEDPNLDEVFTYDWSRSDNVLVSSSGLNQDRFVFDPAELEDGVYRVHLELSDSRAETVSNEVLIQIVDEAAADINSNGIADAVDETTMAFVLQLKPSGELMETVPGLSLRLGETAIYSGADGALISLQELEQLGGAGSPVNATTDYSFDGGLFDFVVEGLRRGGQSVHLVLPQLAPVSENAVYRKFMVVGGWQDFVVDDLNAVFSTNSEGGVCPAAGSDRYESGLAVGSDCVQLYIEDGGPNDADNEANGVIRDPGGVGVPLNAPGGASNGGDSPTEGGSDGGGVVSLAHWLCLWIVLLGQAATRWRMQRSTN